MSISNENCSVYGCNSIRKKQKRIGCTGIMYHGFPKEGEKVRYTNEQGISEMCDRRKLWITKLKMTKKVSKHTKVCSLHFTTDDYECSGWSSRKHLLRTSVPSQNLPQGSCDLVKLKQQRKAERMQRQLRRSAVTLAADIQDEHCSLQDLLSVKEESVNEQYEAMDLLTVKEEPFTEQCVVMDLLSIKEEPVTEQCNVMNFVSVNEEHLIEQCDASDLLSIKEKPVIEHFALRALSSIQDDPLTVSTCNDQYFEALINSNDKCVQVDLSDTRGNAKDAEIQVNFDKLRNCISSEVQVDTMELVCMTNFVSNEQELNCLTGLHSFELLNAIARSLKSTKIDKRIHRLTLYRRVFLTFMKLKLDLPYAVLAILFRISATTCKKVFFDTVVSLAPIMSNVIILPSSEEMQCNMPDCFKEFLNIRVVLNCIAIPVQRNCNGTATVKFMTGVTPTGTISFISGPYEGLVSDTSIFKQSEVIEELSPKDAIMVDKSFIIDDICKQHDIRVIRTPFLKQKRQVSPEEAIQNSKITSARVNIERSNQRVKIFKILSNRLPVNLLPIVQDIVKVACALVNLSNPILANKFIADN